MIADGDAVEADLRRASGVYTRLAALEMLLFPSLPTAAGWSAPSLPPSASVAACARAPGARRAPPDRAVRLGAGRIVPVRVTNLTSPRSSMTRRSLIPLTPRRRSACAC